MTTTAQQTVLSTEELAALTAIDASEAVDPGIAASLIAKGMVSLDASADPRLTPAGRLAIHMPGAGDVPGIDN